MRKTKRAEWPNFSYDAMRLRAALCTGEKLSFKEIVTRAYGAATCITMARATRAILVLMARKQIAMCRTGRTIQEVRCLDNGQYNYMQLDACVYLMVCAAVQATTENSELL